MATRPDILPVPLAEALGDLYDNLPPFDNLRAKKIIQQDIQNAMTKQSHVSQYLRNENDLRQFMTCLSKQPIAAASVSQVYKGELPGYGSVAVKVLRPGIRQKVEQDATLFHSIATWGEWWMVHCSSMRHFDKNLKRPHGAVPLVPVVDEFTARVLEDMDFGHEIENMKLFAQLYDSKIGLSPTVKVVVPEVIEELSSSRVLVMEWLEGTKLTDIGSVSSARPDEVEENLALIIQAIEMTVSQLIDYGVLHGDPNTGNLLKIKKRKGLWKKKPELGFLDFGIVATVPQSFRDGLVCAVIQLVFARNTEAVADLCVDLGLLPKTALEEPKDRKRFMDALQKAIDSILIWPKSKRGISTDIPKVRFEKILPALTPLIQGFEFNIPPYSLNNVRALATLEGMALKLDPNFNVLRIIYPYSINRLMRNPRVSYKVQQTFLDICRSPKTKLISAKRVQMLLKDWALWTGYRKRKIFWDVITSAGGRRVAPVILYNWCLNRLRNVLKLASFVRQLFTKTIDKMRLFLLEIGWQVRRSRLALSTTT
ncbi:hypothetical protein ACA910_000282 [Epithemia clementina (nom. ined.)]